MVRLSLALLYLPALAMASLRGVDDNERTTNLLNNPLKLLSRRELMANMMFSAAPGRGGRGNSNDDEDDDSSDDELTCKDFTCSSTACTTNKGKFAGNVGCLGGSEFCVRSNKWSQACRVGISCGSCDGLDTGGGEEDDTISCEESCSATTCLVAGGNTSGVEICNTSSNETLCVASQDVWMNLCTATEATCGACGTSTEDDDSMDDNSMDDEDDASNCGNETVSEFCTPIIADENATYIHGGPGAADSKVARCGDVHDLCDNNASCGSQSVDNQSPSGGTFKVNCATLTKGNSIMRRNFAAACCVEQDLDFGNTTDDSEDSDEGDDGNGNNGNNGNGNNGNGNGNSGNNGNGNGNGNNGNGNNPGNNGNGNGNGNNGNGNGVAGIEIEGVGNITFVDDSAEEGENVMDISSDDNSTDFESDDGNSTSIDDGNSTDIESDDGNSTSIDDASDDSGNSTLTDSESEEGDGNNGNDNGNNGNGNGQGDGADSEEEGDEEGANNGNGNNGNGNGSNGNGNGNNGNGNGNNGNGNDKGNNGNGNNGNGSGGN